MKSERRHELQHNDLLESILKGYERIAPYKNAILGVSVIVIVLLIARSFWNSYSTAQSGEAWNSFGIPMFRPDFANEQTIGVMQRTAQTYPRTPAAEWADVFAGDTALMIGTNKILTEKKVGIKYLTDARDLYAKALETLTIPAAREQAMFGKARAMESLIENKAQLDEVLAVYQELNKSFPKGMFKVVAEQRIKQLQKNETLTFYETLAQYTPKPKAESLRSPLGNGPLSENPPDGPLVPTPPVRGGGSQSNPTLGLPEPSMTPKEPAKQEAPKTVPVKTEAPKTEAPKTEAPKTEAPKTEAPKTEAPKPQVVEPEVSKPDVPKKDK